MLTYVNLHSLQENPTHSRTVIFTITAVKRCHRNFCARKCDRLAGLAYDPCKLAVKKG
jgi:hypothetical protein